MRSEEDKLDHILMGISESVDGISNEDFLCLEDAITELLTLRRALSLSPENVERYHKDLEISDIDIRHVISGIRRRVGLEV